MKTGKPKGLALILLALSQLILALDYTIVFVAMPSLAASLGFTANSLQWVVSAYSLTYGGFLIVGGRLSDWLGQRRMFMLAMGLFGLGSLLGGLADSQLPLIIARGIQGLGGALLSPATLSLIMSNFKEGPERNRAMSVWASMGGVGLSLGLLLGGILTSYTGWESTFLVNVPIALLVILLSPVALKESRAETHTRHFDAAGTLSVTAGMVLVVYYLIQAPVIGWLQAEVWIPGLIGAVLLMLFAYIEQRTSNPLVPVRLLKVRNLTGAFLTAALFSASFGTLYYFLTLYTQEVLHYSAVQSGLTFLPLTISALLGAKLINKMLNKFGVKGTIASGMAIGAVGFMMLTPLTEASSALHVIPGLIVIGIGQAFVFTTMYIAGSSGIEMHEQGIASSLVTTGQQLGGSVGLAVIMAIISAAMSSNHSLETMAPTDLNGAVTLAFIIEAVIAVSGIFMTFAALRSMSKQPGQVGMEVTSQH
ncbi:MFS transporter [Paenibacillus chartarius]|uniref:MFS transporter n=1 Tax=Paenibacillus chartarius TaxID=747481 RepID=A0ABV6DQN6_9BACL